MGGYGAATRMCWHGMLCTHTHTHTHTGGSDPVLCPYHLPFAVIQENVLAIESFYWTAEQEAAQVGCPPGESAFCYNGESATGPVLALCWPYAGHVLALCWRRLADH